MAVRGNTGSLAVTLPSDREILMTRVFDAPRELVFEAHTTPEHVRRWWGKHGTTLPVCEMDFRPGGAYRFVQREPGGAEHGFRGEYRASYRRNVSSIPSSTRGCPGTSRWRR